MSDFTSSWKHLPRVNFTWLYCSNVSWQSWLDNYVIHNVHCSLSTCLVWRFFLCVSRQKWGVAWPATGQMTFGETIVCVCISPASKEQIKFIYFVLCSTSRDFKRKLTISGGQKRPKLVWILICMITGKEIYIQWSGEGSLWTNILCRNCADKNETVVWKILEGRESFESSRVHWSQERRDKVRKSTYTGE